MYKNNQSHCVILPCVVTGTSTVGMDARKPNGKEGVHMEPYLKVQGQVYLLLISVGIFHLKL